MSDRRGQEKLKVVTSLLDNENGLGHDVPPDCAEKLAD